MRNLYFFIKEGGGVGDGGVLDAEDSEEVDVDSDCWENLRRVKHRVDNRRKNIFLKNAMNL